jgi:hypothetical protein
VRDMYMSASQTCVHAASHVPHTGSSMPFGCTQAVRVREWGAGGGGAVG